MPTRAYTDVSERCLRSSTALASKYQQNDLDWSRLVGLTWPSVDSGASRCRAVRPLAAGLRPAGLSSRACARAPGRNRKLEINVYAQGKQKVVRKKLVLDHVGRLKGQATIARCRRGT